MQVTQLGLPVEFDWESNGGYARPDVNAIKLTIEREEKIYPQLTVA